MRWILAFLAVAAAALGLRVRAGGSEARFRDLADELPLFVWTHAPNGSVDYANRRLCEFVGSDPGRRRSVPLERFRAVVEPGEFERIHRAFEACFRAGVPYESEHRMKPAGADDSAYRWVLARALPARTGGRTRWIGVATDIDDRRRATEARDAQLRSLAEAAPIVVWRARPDGYADYFNSRWTELTGLAAEASAGWGWTQALHPADVAGAKQLWRRALKSARPYELEFRLRDARRGGYRWQLVRGSPEFGADGGVAAWLTACTDIDDKKRSEANLRLLIDTGTQLLSSLGVREAFAAVVRVLVPEYADWAAVSTVDAGGVPCIAAIRHADAGFDARAAELVGTTYGPGASESIAAAARSGGPHVWTAVPEEWLNAMPEPARSEFTAFATLSAVAVPIRTNGRVAAVLTLGRARGDRGFEERDLPAYCELARRIGIAAKHAESFENERRVATSFQRAALPAVLPSHPAVAFDAVYEAGHSEALVGGDWYDAFVLVDGRVVVSIGDVSGNGLAAALTMSVVRQTIRAAARVSAEPIAILDAADRTLRSDDPDRIVTAFVGVFDPTTGEFTYAGAGHPPPLLRRAAGTIEELGAAGPPLGLRRRSITTGGDVVQLEEGALVVLYTDGLTEATRDVFEGERRLRSALADDAIARSATPAHGIKSSVLRHGSSDDVAVLTLAVHGTTVAGGTLLPHTWLLAAGDLEASVRARHQFAQRLRAAGVPQTRCDMGELVFGEIVSNAIRHGDGAVDVRLEWTGRRPVLHVFDRGPGYRYSGERAVDGASESGRGLFLVSMLTEDFNVSRRSGGGSHSRAVLACEAPAATVSNGRP